MKFKQNVREFFGSKTNWSGLVAIGSGILGWKYKILNPVEAFQIAMGGIAMITIKDAIAGNKINGMSHRDGQG